MSAHAPSERVGDDPTAGRGARLNSGGARSSERIQDQGVGFGCGADDAFEQRDWLLGLEPDSFARVGIQAGDVSQVSVIRHTRPIIYVVLAGGTPLPECASRPSASRPFHRVQVHAQCRPGGGQAPRHR